jgi:hypothetical protein
VIQLESRESATSSAWRSIANQKPRLTTRHEPDCKAAFGSLDDDGGFFFTSPKPTEQP